MSDVMSVHIAISLKRGGGRKEIILPFAPGSETNCARFENNLIKAVARAFRWKRMLETGAFVTINELAKREGIAPSYMTRVLRLTLLAPENVETIWNGRQMPDVTLAKFLQPFPVEWKYQT